jgi:methylmalonic aciduria homocystinuria type C protein
MPDRLDATALVAALAESCRGGGLDLHAATSVGRYNATVETPYRLPGRGDELVVVIGNTRALWPPLSAQLVAAHDAAPDPVDRHVEAVVHAAVTAHVPEAVLVDVRFAHEPPPRRIAIQRLAHEAGLAWLSPSHLCVHATYGPWIALRAAIVLRVPAPADVVTAPEPAAPCDCATNCLPLLQAALAAGEPTNEAELREHWRLWLAMRDACPVGRGHRYDEEQIEYHYAGVRPASWPS